VLRRVVSFEAPIEKGLLGLMTPPVAVGIRQAPYRRSLPHRRPLGLLPAWTIVAGRVSHLPRERAL